MNEVITLNGKPITENPIFGNEDQERKVIPCGSRGSGKLSAHRQYLEGQFITQEQAEDGATD